MVLSTKPFALPAFASAAQAGSPVLDMWSRISILYKDAFDASAQDLLVSSTRIVQEHTLRAMVAASQSCAEALAQNAAKVQQQSFDRLLAANRRAAEIMGHGWIEAMTPRLATAS